MRRRRLAIKWTLTPLKYYYGRLILTSTRAQRKANQLRYFLFPVSEENFLVAIGTKSQLSQAIASSLAPHTDRDSE